MIGVCADCKYHNDYTGVCTSPDSDFRADFTDGMFGCEKYAERECCRCDKYVNHKCSLDEQNGEGIVNE